MILCWVRRRRRGRQSLQVSPTSFLRPLLSCVSAKPTGPDSTKRSPGRQQQRKKINNRLAHLFESGSPWPFWHSWSFRPPSQATIYTKHDTSLGTETGEKQHLVVDRETYLSQTLGCSVLVSPKTRERERERERTTHPSSERRQPSRSPLDPNLVRWRPSFLALHVLFCIPVPASPLSALHQTTVTPSPLPLAPPCGAGAAAFILHAAVPPSFTTARIPSHSFGLCQCSHSVPLMLMLVTDLSPQESSLRSV